MRRPGGAWRLAAGAAMRGGGRRAALLASGAASRPAPLPPQPPRAALPPVPRRGERRPRGRGLARGPLGAADPTGEPREPPGDAGRRRREGASGCSWRVGGAGPSAGAAPLKGVVGASAGGAPELGGWQQLCGAGGALEGSGGARRGVLRVLAACVGCQKICAVILAFLREAVSDMSHRITSLQSKCTPFQ